ncbi:MAG TPA: hemerythrin domain-containing protein [Paludibacter sp.]|nr:hemerythrin domain-containing protein [Paludibacter sp.]
MQIRQKFSAEDKMSDLIKEDISLLLVISRFGLSLGFGNKTVREVCQSGGIDCATFLAVVNFLCKEFVEVGQNIENISPESLIDYLRNSHVYFLEFKLPAIRNKLLEAVNATDQNIPYGMLFMKFFDEYFAEVQKHMEYEDEVVFSYVLDLLKGTKNPKYSISIFQNKHNEIDSKLEELKNILVKYYPSKGNNYLLTDVLSDILSCETDLASHNRVEDYLFVPAIEALEQKFHVK